MRNPGREEDVALSRGTSIYGIQNNNIAEQLRTYLRDSLINQMAEGCQNYINEEYVEDILDTADFAIVSVHKDSPEWICCGGNCTSQFTEGVESDRPTLYRRYLVEGPVECWLQLWNNIDGLKALLENHHGGTHHIQATDSQFPSNRDVNFNITTEAQLEPFQKD